MPSEQHCHSSCDATGQWCGTTGFGGEGDTRLGRAGMRRVIARSRKHEAPYPDTCDLPRATIDWILRQVVVPQQRLALLSPTPSYRFRPPVEPTVKSALRSQHASRAARRSSHLCSTRTARQLYLREHRLAQAPGSTSPPVLIP